MASSKSALRNSHSHLSFGMVFVRGLLSGLKRKGITFDHWLRAVGIDPEKLNDNESTVTAHQYAELFRMLIRDLNDEGVCLLSRPLKPGSFELQMRSTLEADTLEGAIKRIVHVLRLLNDDLEFIFCQEDGLAGVELHFHHADTEKNPFVHEQFLRIYWRAFAWLVGGNLPAERFDFAFPRPSYCEGYGRIFPAPWRFDAPHSAMWFLADRMRYPACRDKDALRTFVANSPVNVILPRRDLGYSERVRVHLNRSIPAWPDLEATAAAMNMSVSSLQRHMVAEGTTFRELRDQLRRDIAIFRLNTSEVSLIQLASDLGFADATVFQRAFKSWTGYPPGQYRRTGKSNDN